jgi:hypothetical protein
MASVSTENTAPEGKPSGPPNHPGVCILSGVVSLAYMNQSVTSYANGFYVRNNNNSNAQIQPAGGSAATIYPGQWSQKFVARGTYNVFALESVIQLTINFNGGSMEVNSGTAAGQYSVWADMI